MLCPASFFFCLLVSIFTVASLSLAEETNFWPGKSLKAIRRKHLPERQRKNAIESRSIQFFDVVTKSRECYLDFRTRWIWNIPRLLADACITRILRKVLFAIIQIWRTTNKSFTRAEKVEGRSNMPVLSRWKYLSKTKPHCTYIF